MAFTRAMDREHGAWFTTCATVYITSFNATNLALNEYRYSMKTVNVGFGYQYRPWLNFSVDVANLLNEPQEWYVGYKNRLRRHIENFVTITFGVNGRF